jgi:murein DD-endopeptidase MepM/ murein hydrolase activator NlpD
VPNPAGRGAFHYRRTATHVHQGIDLAAPEGTPVVAAASGVVSRLIDRPGTVGFRGYGKAVVLRHQIPQLGGQVFTLYAHLSALAPGLVLGSVVAEGQRIGAVGRTCDTRADASHRCGGSHLHFELSAGAYPQASEAPRLDPLFFSPEATT